MDIDGTDAAHKLSILASIAYGARVDFPTPSPIAGISGFDAGGLRDGSASWDTASGLLAVLEKKNKKIEARVQATP